MEMRLSKLPHNFLNENVATRVFNICHPERLINIYCTFLCLA